MTAQFTDNPPVLPGATVSTATLPIFAGGDSNRSPTLAEWNNYVVGKELVMLYTDGNLSAMTLDTASSYTTKDAQGNAMQGTYDYDRIDESKGRLTVMESKTYRYGQYQTALSTVYTSERKAVFDLNFYAKINFFAHMIYKIYHSDSLLLHNFYRTFELSNHLMNCLPKFHFPLIFVWHIL